jgi:hypothetical protein
MLPAGPALGNLVAYHLMTALTTSIHEIVNSIRLQGLDAAYLFCSATFLNVVYGYTSTSALAQGVP